jgi:tetratricopeptide (TPR) repeat protein
MADVLLSEGKFFEAIPLLQKQIAEDPANTSAACDCAFAHLNVDMARGCLKLCDQVIALDSTCVRAYALKTEACLKMSKRKKARSALDAGLAACTTDEQRAIFRELLSNWPVTAKDLLREGKYSEAIPLLQKQIEDEYPNTNAICDCAFAHLQLDMARGCLKLCDKAIAADSSCVRAYELKAKAYIKMSKPKKAATFIMDVVHQNPKLKANPDIQAVMSQLGLDMGTTAAGEGSSVGSKGGGSGSAQTKGGDKGGAGGAGGGSDSSAQTKKHDGPKRGLGKSVWNTKNTWEEVGMTDCTALPSYT